MDFWVVEQQMIIIFILIMIGVFLFKKKHLSNDSARQLSWIIVNVTNPITLLCAAISEEDKVGAKEIGVAFLCFVIMFAILIPLAYLIPVLLGVDKSRQYAYRMLAIFGNVGFIGIPFSAAVLGPESLIFVSVCGLTFNLVVYTYGVESLKAVAAEQNPEQEQKKSSLKDLINSGTVLAVITIVVYLADIKLPEFGISTLRYIGNCTTFLSMVVLGVSVAQMVPKEVFSRWRLYVFVVIRQILVPIMFIFLLRPFLTNTLILHTVVVMVAMPAGNMPLMLARQFGAKEDMISAGIIMTTVASIITIPAVMYFL
ncbi:MAG: AEC family transporter [Lachnospiraceae bacterium]|nr:AEC family transporter [Lachnospiraceae bacterium]